MMEDTQPPCIGAVCPAVSSTHLHRLLRYEGLHGSFACQYERDVRKRNRSIVCVWRRVPGTLSYSKTPHITRLVSNVVLLPCQAGATVSCTAWFQTSNKIQSNWIGIRKGNTYLAQNEIMWTAGIQNLMNMWPSQLNRNCEVAREKRLSHELIQNNKMCS